MRILIENATIVSMKEEPYNGSILIEDDKIIALGDIKDRAADKVINANKNIVMPGLINAHTHVAMSLFRGAFDELKLMEWLNKVWPIEDKMTKEDVYYASILSIIEMIKSGTTTFADHYFFEEETAKAAQEAGMRAVLARCIINEDEEADRRLKEAEELYKNWNGKADGTIKVCVGVHAPYTCPPSTLEKSVALAKKLKTPIHIHYLETRDEVHEIQQKYDMTVTDYLEENGVFGVKTILAHGVHVYEQDIMTLQKYDCSIVHNPISNQKLGSGIANVKMLNECAINVALGTDGQGSTNTLDMFEEMKSAAYMQKVDNFDTTAISAKKVIEMATINGAKALGFEDIGTIEVGKKADIIMIDIHKPHLLPLHNIYSLICYSVNGADVDTVIINGKIVMENRKLANIDEEEIMYKCIEIAKRLF